MALGGVGDVLRRIAQGVGELFVTLGFVVLLFAVYEVYFTDVMSSREQAHLTEELRAGWANPAEPDLVAVGAGTEPEPVPPVGPVAVGEAFAFMHIPRFGPDWVRAVVEGTGWAQLEQGPGHYAETAMPGQPGNFAVAGHRVGRGSPFRDLDEMQPGDPIVVETADGWYVYRVLDHPTPGPTGIPGQQIVSPKNLSVISPTPNGPAGGPATGAYLTLTTCNPEYSARERLIVHAVLDGDPIPKVEAPDGPAVLTES